MTTFSDLTRGRNMTQYFFYASNKTEAIEAIKSANEPHHYYIVNDINGTNGIQIYLDIKAIPNGAAAKGKIYEGKSKKAAIEALSN